MSLVARLRDHKRMSVDWDVLRREREEAADEIERLTRVQTEMQQELLNAGATLTRLRAIILAARRNGSIPEYPGDMPAVETPAATEFSVTDSIDRPTK